MAVGLSKDELRRDLSALLRPAEVTLFDFPVARQWGVVVKLGRKTFAQRFDKSDVSLPSILEEIGTKLRDKLDDKSQSGRRSPK